MNEKLKKSLPLIVFISAILIGLFSLFISYRVSGILPGEMFPVDPYAGSGGDPGTAVPNNPAPNEGSTYNAAGGCAGQHLQEPIEAPKPLPFWKKILNSIFNLLGLTKRGAEMFPTQQGSGECWWTWDENKGQWFPSDANGVPLPGGITIGQNTYITCPPPYTQPNYPTGLAATGNCVGSWNCWPNEDTWKAAFCDLHPGQCQSDKPPDWAYNDVADAVNFVQQNGRGPTDQEWIDRWHTGHTWGTFLGTQSCPAGFGNAPNGTCYLLGFQPGASGGNCPNGCAMTQGPASSTDPTGLTCDCPTDGTCGSSTGGGLGYFTDLDCPCNDTDPSTVCGEGGGDDTTDDDDTTTPTPTPTPTFECTDLGPEPTSSPEPGDQLTFTCRAAITGSITINHYNFQVINSASTVLSSETVTTSNLQANYTYTVPETGNSFIVQCQACTSANDSSCTAWGQAH